MPALNAEQAPSTARFALPDTADAEAISALGKHGVLEVIIPKREKAKARKIEVADKN